LTDVLAPSSAAAPDSAANGHADASYLARTFHATEEANYRAVLRALPAARGGSLLDLGMSTGEFTGQIAERLGATAVQGVDFIAEHVASARERGVDAVEADIEQGLPFPDGAFDTVTANQVLEHVRRTDVMLAEIHRVLAPGGLACIGTNNLSSWHNVLSLVLGFQPPPMHVSDEVILGNPLNPEHGWPHRDRGRTHLRLFTARALRELAARHGLELVRIRSVGYYPLPPWLARFAARADPLHGAFLVGLFRRGGA
jgi:SAM-dependent methyltransferase